MKYLTLFLLLVVWIKAQPQNMPDNLLHTIGPKLTIATNEDIDSLKRDVRNLRLLLQFNTDIGNRYIRKVDSLRKEVDSFKGRLNYWPFNTSVHDPSINIEDISKFNASELYLQEEHLDLTPDTISITTVSAGTQHMKRFDKIKKVWVDVPILKRSLNRKHIDTATIKARLRTAFKDNGGGLIYYRLNKLDPDPSDTIWMGYVMFDGNVCRPITGLYRGHEVVAPEIFDYMIWEKKTGRLLPIDSNGTYHDHMPTLLTVKKRHKHHKWVKKSPPPTKDSGEKTVR